MSSHMLSRVLAAFVLVSTVALPGLALGESAAEQAAQDLVPVPPEDHGAGGELTLDPPVVSPRTETAAAQAEGGQQLHGVFRLTAGECAGEGVTSGSYFRMVNPGGDPDGGPYVGNGDSPCGDDTYTPLQAGTEGGLSTTAYQPHPDPPFSAAGGGTNDKITQPAPFFGVPFSTATEETDRQTGTDVPVPAITFDCGGGLAGDVRAFQAGWNRQFFNQGAPKPDGSTPEGTTGPAGTYDPATQAYSLTWTSRIVGGPFNNFTGVWHLEGTFSGEARGTCPATAPNGEGATQAAASQPPSAGTGAQTTGTAATAGAQAGTALPDTGGPFGGPALALGLLFAGAALWTRQRKAGKLS
jgi:hypothetical protein